MLNEVEIIVQDSKSIGLMIVVGTSAQLKPAAGYVDETARKTRGSDKGTEPSQCITCAVSGESERDRRCFFAT